MRIPGIDAHSLGPADEELTAHPGFPRCGDGYEVMALASCGKPRFPPRPRPQATGPYAVRGGRAYP
ncbi:hypothetical protein ACH4UM_30110 [Streptomyces sp. NPDC020801]|uniref:hypothetical protein n=1 Tax=unclassified Streptomyces TaxID=2593676 RepID=UPI003796BFED